MSLPLLSRFVLLFLLICGHLTSAESSPAIELPKPTGPFPVGRESFHWVDESRNRHGGQNEEERRELMVHLWYPAERAEGATPAQYFGKIEAIKGAVNDAEYDVLASVRSHAFSGARFASNATPCPVVIFSHGNQMNGFLYTALMEDLASHGYAAIGMDHPFEALVTRFPDGRIIRYSEKLEPDPRSPSFQKELRGRIQCRVADIRFVIGRLSRLNSIEDSRWSGRVDMTRLGVAGHSNGGIAAVEACRVEEAIRACVNLDGRAAGRPFYPATDEDVLAKPFMYMAKPFRQMSDQELQNAGITRVQFESENAATMKRDESLLRGIKVATCRVVINGATHESFSDAAFLQAASDDERARNALILEVTRDYLRAFFDRHLKAIEGPLLSRSASPYSFVTFEAFGGEKN